MTPTVIYPPEPRDVTFEAEDGQRLQGVYYPSGESLAPVVVLMHWTRGDQSEWDAVARWLQNRGTLAGVSPGQQPWTNPGWFPAMPEPLAPAVFTFTFRGCDGGCSGFPSADWLLDARAAMEAASQLEGVDRHRVLAVGASIGADGAVDGCAWMNREHPGDCLGAFALSPGSYLTVPYPEAARELLGGDSPAELWCLFAERDNAARETCQSVPDANVVNYGYTDLHGFELITQDLDPDVLVKLVQFLEDSLEKGE